MKVLELFAGTRSIPRELCEHIVDICERDYAMEKMEVQDADK